MGRRLGVCTQAARKVVSGLCACALILLAPGAVRSPDPVTPGAPASPDAFLPTPQQQAFLDQVERDTFRLFWEASPAETGLTPDRAPGSNVSSVAAVGFALTSYLVGVERGYVTRADAAARTLTTLETLWKVPQGPEANGVGGHQGLFYHFVDVRQGLRAWDSELSTIDTALLMAGVLSAQVYFDRDDAVERSIREIADRLYRRVDWSWATSRRAAPLLSMGWTPEAGFIGADWSGYNEGMILYVLALGSPTHAIEPRAWEEWTHSYRWEGERDTAHVAFGPLFGHQYSHVWIDFRSIKDAYMRSKGSDYFVNSVRATHANRDYCIANAGKWKGYDALVWGLTASDGPFAGKPGAVDAAGFHSYWARGATPGGAADDGTIAPTAAGGSVPFAPEVTIPTLMHLRERFGDRIYGQYGFKDAFNLSYPAPTGGEGWFDDQYLAIDSGPILLMIENYRSRFIWNLMKRSPYVANGLRKAGFSGGWLDTTLAQQTGPLPLVQPARQAPAQ
jgi:hypothetical protein